jgi:hypothetical protein
MKFIPNTDYYFKMYGYTNSGVSVNSKTDELILPFPNGKNKGKHSVLKETKNHNIF